MSTEHPSEDVIDRYAMGLLDEASAAEVEEHLLGCVRCQNRLVDTDEFVAAFRVVAVEPDVRPASRWQRMRQFGKFSWLTVAGATALAILVFIPVTNHVQRVPVTIELQALRGPETAARVAAGTPALLKFDLPSAEAKAYQVEVVDAAGAEVFRTPASMQGGRLVAGIRKLSRGTYWVRLYEQPDDLIAEYGLRAD
jgi:anti-sigma factor RsiW